MESSQFFGIATVAYVIAMIVYIAYLAFKKEGIGLAGTAITAAGLLAHTVALGARWIEFYRLNAMYDVYRGSGFMGALERFLRSAPLTNLYESLIFFVWCLIAGYLLVEWKFKNRSLGAFITPIAALVLAFISLHGISDRISPLVPALQSNWLLVHVLMSFIAYSTFAIAFATALLYLVVETSRQQRPLGFWIFIAVFMVVFGITINDPTNKILWVVNALLILGADFRINIDFAAPFFARKQEDGQKGSAGMGASMALLLTLVSVAMFFIIIMLIKVQIAKARNPIEAGAVDIGLVGFAFFSALIYLKYMIVKKDYYLFWSSTLGVALVILAAMGLDFLKFNLAGGSGPMDAESQLLRATFLSSVKAVSVASYVAAGALFYAVWRYGESLKKLVTGFKLESGMLDYITYKCITIGFPIFTLGGLIFGAIWADQAWGVYWSWDPKETWSLITWFFYAFYLHARLLRGWKGKKIAVVAVLGFAAVVFTYLGVNMLLSGLHAYGSQ